MSTSTAKKTKTTRAATSKPPTAPKPASPKAKVAHSALDGSLPAPEPNPAVKPNVMKPAQSVILGPVMRKKELIDAVVAEAGMKKKDVKPVVEAMLSVLGDALAEKRELNLQPLGKIKVRRERQMPNGRMLVTKIRQAARKPKTPKV